MKGRRKAQPRVAISLPIGALPPETLAWLDAQRGGMDATVERIVRREMTARDEARKTPTMGVLDSVAAEAPEIDEPFEPGPRAERAGKDLLTALILGAHIEHSLHRLFEAIGPDRDRLKRLIQVPKDENGVGDILTVLRYVARRASALAAASEVEVGRGKRRSK